MATESSNQKRKRGRPPNASKPPASTNASQNDIAAAPAEYDADAEEESRPKKRGRPRKSIDALVNEEPEPRKRGRPATRPAATKDDGQDEPPNAANEEAAPDQPRRAERRNARKSGEDSQGGEPRAAQQPTRKKRGRPSLKSAEVAHNEASQEADATQPAPRRKRGRPSLDAQNGPDERPQDELDKAQPGRRKKRGRPSLQPAPQSEEQQPLRKKARGRPSLQDISPSGAQNINTKAKERTKPHQNDTHSPPVEVEKQLSTVKDGKKKRRRQLDTEQSSPKPRDEPRRSEEADTEPSKAERQRRRRSSQNASLDAAPPPSPSKPYIHVAPRVRRVRQSVIEDKWSPLSGAALAAATTILQLAHRPILQRLAGTQQRRTQAFAALRLVASRIARKMFKGLPFPPATMAAPRRGRRKVRDTATTTAADDDGDGDGGREAELDFERVLDARQALERQLDPALHAVDLLRREKERVERELERDYQALKALETGARSQMREQRGLLKKAHVLAPEGLASQRLVDGADLEFKHEDTTATGDLFKNLDEDDLQPLALQLNGHMDSIKTNLQQAEGIVPQIAETRAVLQDVLLRHLQPEQYEQVVLG